MVPYSVFYKNFLGALRDTICWDTTSAPDLIVPDYEVRKVENYCSTGLLVFNHEKYFAGELLTSYLGSSAELGFYIVPVIKSIAGWLTGEISIQIILEVNNRCFSNPELKSWELAGRVQRHILTDLRVIPVGAIGEVYLTFDRVRPGVPREANFTSLTLFITGRYCCQFWME